MASRRHKRKKDEETNGGTSDEGGTNLPAHTVPEHHLSEQAAQEGPGINHEPDQGTAQATSIAGGALGQRVGLPAPLPPKAAAAAGFRTDAEKEADQAEADKKAENEEGKAEE